MNFLIMTIGQRDCMEVFAQEDKIIRREIFKMNINELDSLPYTKTEMEIRTKQENDEVRNLKNIGIDFPMLNKNFIALKDLHQISHIHKLILIVTDRQENLPLIHKAKEESVLNHWTECVDFADELKKYIHNDKSKQTSKLIINKMKEITLLHNVKIDEVEVISIGQIYAEDFEDFKMINSTQMMTYLKSFDLNNIDFLTRQFHNKFINLYDISEIDFPQNNIFYSLYAGGLPLLQKAVENVINTSFLNSNLISLNITENSSYFRISKNADGYYKTLKDLIQSIKNNDFYNADRKYNQLIEYINKELNEPLLKDIETLFYRIKEEKESKKNWFYNLFSLFLSSIYKDDFITASVFLVSIEDQFFRHLINKYIEFNFIDNGRKISLKEVEYEVNINLINILIENQNNQEYQKIIDDFEYNFKPLFLKINKANFSKFKLIYTGNYQKLRDERNFFIHRGIALNGCNKIKENILHFLRITKYFNEYKKIIKTREYKWQDILNFEKCLLTEDTIFRSIALNVYGENFNLLTPEREIGLELIHLLTQIVL